MTDRPIARARLVHGAVDSGKTRRVAAWAETETGRGRAVGGVLARKTPQGRRFVDLTTGDEVALEHPAPGEIEVPVGRFVFRQAAFDWAEARIEAAVAAGCDAVVIDEVGPLELRGEGFADLLVLLVRTGLVEAVTGRFAAGEVLTLDPPSDAATRNLSPPADEGVERRARRTPLFLTRRRGIVEAAPASSGGSMTDQLADEAPVETVDSLVDPHADRPLARGRTDVYRHPPLVRITHWINVAAVVVLLMSGANILLAHPHLYWGVRSTFADPWINIPPIPNWLLIPQGRNLAEARHWHFFFAWVFVLNGLAYLAYGFASRRFGRRLWPTRADLGGFWASVREHARFRFPKDDEARTYNVIQKLTYVAIILVILPMMLITGLSMSPGFNAVGGVLLEIMGGRQSARTLHFISAGLIIGFIVIHVGLVVWTGLWNNLRAMVTGWFVIEPSDKGDPS